MILKAGELIVFQKEDALMHALADMIGGITEVVSNVREAADNVASGSTQLSAIRF